MPRKKKYVKASKPGYDRSLEHSVYLTLRISNGKLSLSREAYQLIRETPASFVVRELDWETGEFASLPMNIKKSSLGEVSNSFRNNTPDRIWLSVRCLAKDERNHMRDLIKQANEYVIKSQADIAKAAKAIKPYFKLVQKKEKKERAV